MDHLGPHAWPHLSSKAAWQKTAELVQLCVKAGYDKLHIDTVTGNGHRQPDGATVAQAAVQTAELCRIAEKTAQETRLRRPPVYVIGTDVPVPGGGMQTGVGPVVTTPQNLEQTLSIFQKTFSSEGLDAAWEGTTAIVVQPGVDFGDYHVATYCPEKAAALAGCQTLLPNWMTFEVHAADYQPPRVLGQLISDGFHLLKIGPCLTFGLRQTLYALSHIEEVLPQVETPSRLREAMESAMNRHPEHWRHHYRGSLKELYYLRHFSYKDRIRYYWNRPAVRQAVQQLADNLKPPFPNALIEQYLPDMADFFAGRQSGVDLEKIVKHRIDLTLMPYMNAGRKA